MRESADNQEDARYVLVSKSKLLALRSAIEEYAKENEAIKKDLEKLRRIKVQGES
jgi:ribosomal protein L4